MKYLLNIKSSNVKNPKSEPEITLKVTHISKSSLQKRRYLLFPNLRNVCKIKRNKSKPLFYILYTEKPVSFRLLLFIKYNYNKSWEVKIIFLQWQKGV